MNFPTYEAEGSLCPLRDYILQIKIPQQSVPADPAELGQRVASLLMPV